jgi:branched-chain amino acid aminotransferase
MYLILELIAKNIIIANKNSCMERAFMYGDLIFETIKVVNAKPLLVSYHYNRLVNSAFLLNFKLPVDFNFETFSNQLQQAIINAGGENNYKNQYRLRYTIYRKSTGFYLPHNHTTDYHIDVFLLDPSVKIDLLKVGIYKVQKKSSGPLSNLKSGNALIYVMASIWAKENGFEDALILNEHNRIIEATSSNLFWIKDNVTYTPPLSEGCVAGVYRSFILDNEQVTEKVCTLTDLEQADEIFITNTINHKRFIKLFF